MTNPASAVSIVRDRAQTAGRDEVIGVQRMRKPFPLGKPKANTEKSSELTQIKRHRAMSLIE